jgi:hypothetical protein
VVDHNTFAIDAVADSAGDSSRSRRIRVDTIDRQTFDWHLPANAGGTGLTVAVSFR